jgi:hypothetical protein
MAKVKWLRGLRNVSALVFFVSVFMSAPVLSVQSQNCPPSLAGSCDGCWITTGGYVYTGCEEDCNENEDICEDWCETESATDTCQFDEGVSCGHCDCGFATPRVREC